jgi:plastocyanin
LTYRFGRTANLARVDLDTPTRERLFADDGVAELETRGVDPSSPDSRGASPTPKTTVDIIDFAYHPGELRVALGTAVTFVNRDGEPHTITALDGSFDSGALDAKSQCAFGVQVDLDGGSAPNMGDFLKRGYLGRHAADNLRVSLPAFGDCNDIVSDVGNKHASQSHGFAGESRRGRGDDRGCAQQQCSFKSKQCRSPLDDPND